MNDDFERLVNRFSSEWQAEARKAFARLFELLKDGKKLDVAVDMLQAEYSALFTLTGLQPTLVEAACYGYGIAPTVLTAAMYKDWEADLSKSWAADNMKLSKRLHTASIEMRNRIIDTIREQMSRNSSWVQTARALFDGYNADKVINEQALPKYITEVRRATRGSVEQLRAARRAIYNIERLAKNGAPTKSLKTAYKNLVEAALIGSEKQLENACYVAIQEKSRYVADRIARTEQARAYSDGFFRSVADDEDVVAVRWQLGTRHPVFDICDMYMRADLFGLGAGIYPKDKTPPLPAHPFCLCRLSKVYSLDKKPADQIRRGGDKWLQGMSEVHQNMVLGIEGARAWRKGDDWRKYMRSWQGVGKADTRLRQLNLDAVLKNGYKNGKIDIQIDKFTPCLVERETGKVFDTTYSKIEITKAFAKQLKQEGWNFDWSLPAKEGYSVYQLNLKTNKTIQGLLATKVSDGFVDFALAETAPHNYGSKGKFEGVGGHLFAIACKQSFNAGLDGYVSFTAKTKLIKYYANKFGAMLINGQRMYIDTKSALDLLAKYTFEEEK